MQVVKGLWRFSIWERNCQCFRGVFLRLMQFLKGFMKVFNVWGKGLWRFLTFEARVYEGFQCLRQGFMKVFNVWGRFSLIQRITKSGVQKLGISVIFKWMVVACFKELLSTSNSLIANVLCCFLLLQQWRWV